MRIVINEELRLVGAYLPCPVPSKLVIAHFGPLWYNIYRMLVSTHLTEGQRIRVIAHSPPFGLQSNAVRI
jgi:hypothetical protein